ncbi:serine/threonine-protein phosphatase 7 long form [Dorcoceras hygrometricum]|uniref:Serine/threonine-protein phosphatase 7 long form n=1 Tax=Dorcoceras hygrometricum TaxID=472368 RepID=A0A2Z7D126_9LAMI|nr:serine/threonine-protein phosphatase 7 long form [Dorcoceras hygrometricum]
MRGYPMLSEGIIVCKSLARVLDLGKWFYLVANAMSQFDLQDVCMAIESLATLDLQMIIDSVKELSVIPRVSWGDVARRFIMIRWCSLTKESRIWSWTGLANLPQSTEKSRVLETPVGARHKCQRG